MSFMECTACKGAGTIVTRCTECEGSGNVRTMSDREALALQHLYEVATDYAAIIAYETGQSPVSNIADRLSATNSWKALTTVDIEIAAHVLGKSCGGLTDTLRARGHN